MYVCMLVTYVATIKHYGQDNLYKEGTYRSKFQKSKSPITSTIEKHDCSGHGG